MEWLRRAANPWGQEVLLGIAWDLMWAAVIAGAAFVVGHAIFAKVMAGRAGAVPTTPDDPNVPARVLRHGLAARVFHWVMAAAMIVLLVTAFFPVMGLQFPWVTVHWIAGLVLFAAVLYHAVHAMVRHSLRSMWIGRRDLHEGATEMKRVLGRAEGPPERTGKYPVDHKLYHHVVTVVTVGVIATGLLMMVRVDTPFWARNPYLLGDGTWGFVYVVHGVSAVALITLTMAHIYFAVRPDKWWITMSMINGWIGRKEYLTHHDPALWPASASTDAAVTGRRAETELESRVGADAQRAG